MKRRIPGALGIMMSLIPSALLSQNLPPVAVDDTVYMCGTTVTIYVQQNDTNPDGDSLTMGIYSGSINGSFTINGNAIDYTPNTGYTGTDTLVYSLCDDGIPSLCDTATVIIHIGADYFNNASAQICSGDSIFLAGAWQTAAGSYTDWYTTQYGCDSIIVTQLAINPIPVVNISVTGSLNFCTGDSVILTGYGATSWLWSTGATSQSITVFSSGNYSVVASDTNGCSSLAASVNVNALPPPNATISPSGPVTLCQGDSVALVANGGSSWQWSTGETSQGIVVSDPGSYWVIVSNGSCTDTSASVNVIVNPLPVATISASGSTTLCQGESVTLTASSGSSWLWSTGVTTQSINVVSSGNYWVIVSNANGCSDTSASINVIVNPLPSAVITPNGSTTFCEGGTVTLTASNGSSWIWSTGESTQFIVVSDAGTYYCTVTDGNGCSAISGGTSVIVNSAPVAGIAASGSTDLCQGETVTLTAVSGTSWWWSTGATTQSITVSSAGSYYVVCTGDCGSDTSSAVAVSVTNGPPVAGINASSDGYTYSFTDNSAGASSWSWNFGDNNTSSEQNPAHTYSGYGEYLVTLIVSNACGSDTTSMLLSIGNPEHLSIYNAFSPNGDGHNDVWNIPMLNYNSQNTVTIVNRWGNEVWKGSNYDNEQVVFNGKSLSGEELPDGTYYYIITYGDKDQKELRGWVFIKR